jgi:uncharacterized LabA/DUF88 family protein
MSNQQHKKVYAFIDSQNLNLGVRDAGWKLDFAKFRKFLSDTYRVEQAYLFIGQMPENQTLYHYLQRSGYTLIFKPTQAYYKDGKKTTKGNVDAELVLYSAARLINEYDKAVIVSGDGDFLCLYEYLEEIGKLEKILVPNKRKYSKLIKPFISRIDYVSTKRTKLENKK